MPQIFFNGKKYDSIDEIPVDQRAVYEQVMALLKDENNNGIPDLFEGDIAQKVRSMANARININGQELSGIESLPPETRAKFEKAMSVLYRLGVIPQGSPSRAEMQSEPQTAWSEPAFEQSPPLIQSPPSAISEETGSRTRIIITALAVLLLSALAAAGILLYLKF